MTSPELSPADAARRRRILARAFGRVLPPEAVTAALLYWEEHFAQQRNVLDNLRRNLQQMCEALQVDALRASIYNEIFMASIVAETELPADPLPPAAWVRSAGVGLSAPAGPAAPPTLTLVLRDLLKALGAQTLAAAESEREHFNDLLALQLADVGLSSQQLRFVRAALHGRPEPAPVTFQRAEGRDVVSAWYVAATQSLGPVAADALLSRAVRQVEEGAPGGDLSPRLFL